MTPQEIKEILTRATPHITWNHISRAQAKKRKGTSHTTIYFDGYYRGSYFPVGFALGVDRSTVWKVAKAAEEGFKKAHKMEEL